MDVASRIDPIVRTRLAGLEGLIPHDVGMRLAGFAAEVPPQRAIVELGSYKGRSACYLAAGAAVGLGAHVFCVDPWDTKGNAGGRFGFDQAATRKAFLSSVRSMGFDPMVTALRGFSHEVAPMWTKPIGLLYIDGSHTYGDVWRDWSSWRPHLAPNAIVAFDDYKTMRNPGVEKVVEQLQASLTGVVWIEGPPPLIAVNLP